MLIWMREGKGSKVLKYGMLGLLFLGAIGLAISTRSGGLDFGGGSVNTVAKGAGVNIGIMEFDRSVRRALSQQGIGPQEAYQLGMIDNILMSEIQSRLFAAQARKLGLEVSDADVTRQIAKLAEPLATDGRSKKEALQQIAKVYKLPKRELYNRLVKEGVEDE